MIIKVDIEDIKKAVNTFGEGKVKRAIQLSLNRSIRSSKSEISRLIRQKFNITKADLDRKIHLRVASASALSGEVAVRGEPISLMYFKPYAVSGGIRTFAARVRGQRMPGLAQRKVRGRETGGVVAEIIKGKRTKLAKAFFIVGTGGTPLVVIRRSTGKLQKVAVITEASMFKQQRDKVAEKVITQFKKEFANQIKQLTLKRATWL